MIRYEVYRIHWINGEKKMKYSGTYDSVQEVARVSEQLGSMGFEVGVVEVTGKEVTVQDKLKKSWGRQSEANRGKKNFYDERRKEQAERYRSMVKKQFTTKKVEGVMDA